MIDVLPPKPQKPTDPSDPASLLPFSKEISQYDDHHVTVDVPMNNPL